MSSHVSQTEAHIGLGILSFLDQLDLPNECVFSSEYHCTLQHSWIPFWTVTFYTDVRFVSVHFDFKRETIHNEQMTKWPCLTQ